jgi:mono/diheme cytochrome c family protein
MRLQLAVLSIILAASSVAAASSRVQRAHGAAVFTANGCAHCHRMGNTGGKKGPDLSGVGRKLSKTQIHDQILKGGNEMPSFADDLDKKEVDDLVAYLRSCREKPVKK